MTYRIKFTHTIEIKFIALPKSAHMRIVIAPGNYAADPFHRQYIKKVKDSLLTSHDTGLEFENTVQPSG